MAKSKKKADDFKKVKLKVGKKLKKHTETNTAFKTGKVVLLEQLKRDAIANESVPSTRRKLSLTDLLHHLRHYNANVRKDAVKGLKELLQENSHLIKENLFALIERLGPILTDTESEILKTATAVWEIIFSSVDCSSLAPYWQLLAAHLNCAMTHLNADVKRFSLNIFNLLLTSHGGLFRLSPAYDLVRCFLDSLPHSPTSAGGNLTRSLVPISSKHQLLTTLKNIIPLLYTNETPVDLENPSEIDCRASASGIISVSLTAAEWNRSGAFDLDDYVRPPGTRPSEFDQHLEYINRIFPFCHSLWIEVTSVEDRPGVDCYAFDLTTLVIMNDILAVYNSLLHRPVDLVVSDKVSDEVVEKFVNSLAKTVTKSFFDRYFNSLPCRRAPRKSGEAARLSECDLNTDACSSVNFGLCRFLAYISTTMPNSCSYPQEKISDVLSNSFARERIDTETIRCCAELIRDLRVLVSSVGNSRSASLQEHYSQLSELLMTCLLTQNKRWKVKADIIFWICRDLEDLADLSAWPRFGQFVEQLPSIMSSLVEETKTGSTNSTFEQSVLTLLYRSTRVLLIRLRDLPTDEDVGLRAVGGDLLALLISQINRYSPSLKKQALNLLYYAMPLQNQVIESITALLQNRDSLDTEEMRKFMSLSC